MCLSKKLILDKQTGFYRLPKKNTKISMADYINHFGFFQYIHKDKLKDFKETVLENWSLTADIAASVVAQMYELKPDDKIIKIALHCCQDILISKGYEETHFDKLLRDIPYDQFNRFLIFIPGCQSTNIIRG